MSEQKKTIELNGQQVTEEQLKQQIEEAKHKPGVKIVEVGPGQYRTKLEG